MTPTSIIMADQLRLDPCTHPHRHSRPSPTRQSESTIPLIPKPLPASYQSHGCGPLAVVGDVGVEAVAEVGHGPHVALVGRLPRLGRVVDDQDVLPKHHSTA